jgi:DNA gyrase subunit A
MSDIEELKPEFNENVAIESVMHNSYMEYAMSVIVSRALPDVRDGLKPVHRRVLYAMEEGGYTKDKPYKKSARIVGDVMGKYHPHGDSAIYDTMVRMAQDFSMRSVLIDGQGNFGSIDGDPAAAMRYTEARMSRTSHNMLKDIHKGTVDFRPTYDGSDNEPVVLPTRIPNLLINGSSGIAVGMATHMPAHNPKESIDAVIHLLKNPNASLNDIMEIIPGPDFPTGGIIMGVNGIRKAYETGRGSIVVSGVVSIEEGKKGKSHIVITEFPYNVNKARFQEKVADLVNEKTIEGITDIRDESDRDDNVRVVIDVRKDYDPNLILNKLKKHTQLVDTFSVNSVCLDTKGNPSTMGIMQILKEFVAFRKLVVRKRTIFDLNKARDSLQKQIGLFAAVSLVDEVVKTIRNSSDVDTARSRLMNMDFPTEGEFAELLKDADPDLEEVPSVFRLDEGQANAILALNLRSLTGMERDKIAEKAREISLEIKGYINILNNTSVLNSVVETELLEMREFYNNDERKTRIEFSELDDLSEDDLIERKDVIINITNKGYVKRTPLEDFREQKRGGKGKSGMDTKEEDFVINTISCDTLTPLIFFTSRGIAHSLKAWRLPEASANAKGRPLVNYMPLRSNDGEFISAALKMSQNPDDLEGYSLVFVTDFGHVRRNSAKDFMKIQKNGKIAMNLEDENGHSYGKLVNVILCADDDNILLATRKGQAVRFRVGDLRVFSSRRSVGVRGVKLSNDDKVISATLLHDVNSTSEERQAYLSGGEVDVLEENENGEKVKRHVSLGSERMLEMTANEQFLLTVTENSYGKRSSAYEFRTIARGGKGVAAMNINTTTGKLVYCGPVNEDDGVVLVTNTGQTIRTSIKDIRVQGRTTRGVRLLNLSERQKVVSVAIIETQEEVEDELES